MAHSIDSSSFKNLKNRPSSSPRHSNAHYLAWTPAHEKRLLIVQTQLAKAQAEWSEDQEIWLDEVHELEERKRKYKKALKKESKRGGKKNPLWRTNSSISATSVGAYSEEEGDDEGEEVDTQNHNEQIRRTSVGFSLRRMSTSKRRSICSDGEVFDIRRSQTTPSTPTFGKIFRWWSWKGGKGKPSATSTGLTEKDLAPLRDRRRDSS